MMATILVESCRHRICRPCMLSSCICMKADCFAPVFPYEEIAIEASPDNVFCNGCNTHMSLGDKDCTLPCPHSVWLCAPPFPAHSSYYHTHRPEKRPLEAGTQLFSVPKAIHGTQTFCNVLPDTCFLWNPDISIQVMSNFSVRINHCSRNLQIRLNTEPPIVIYRGQSFHSYTLTEKLHSLTVFAPHLTYFKPGPCKFLRYASENPLLLITEAFQYFTLPALNPMLCTDKNRGILTGARPGIADVYLDDIMVAAGALQCVRCRRIWSLTNESTGMSSLVTSCTKPGMIYGHLQPVVKGALEIMPCVIPLPQQDKVMLPLSSSTEAMSEAKLFYTRWRQLPLSGERALDLPGVVLVIGDIGFIDSALHDCHRYPIIDRSQFQEILLSTRAASAWHRVPHDRLVHFVHNDTGMEIFATTMNQIMFFSR